LQIIRIQYLYLSDEKEIKYLLAMDCPSETINVLRERYNFFQRCQLANESFQQFLKEVRNRAKLCEFQNMEDSLIRDRLVFGINNIDLRAKLLNDGGNPPLDDIIRICGERGAPEDVAFHVVEELVIKREC
jgi:hypothetical protein